MNDNTSLFAFLANGIQCSLEGILKGTTFDFLLVVAQPREGDRVQLNTLTRIKSADNLRTIAGHLLSMADDIEKNSIVIEEEIRKAMLENDDNVEGHA